MRDDDDNTLVLFEEFGGNPSLVNFQTITVGTVCANTHEKHTLELACQGRPISAIKFASFGNPKGTCGSFEKGTCDGENALSIIQKVRALELFFCCKYEFHFACDYVTKSLIFVSYL